MMMGFGLIGVIFVIILVIVLIVAFIGLRPNVYQDKDQRSDPPFETPREILEKRYAKGEINKDEFDQIRKDI